MANCSAKVKYSQIVLKEERSCTCSPVSALASVWLPVTTRMVLTRQKHHRGQRQDLFPGTICTIIIMSVSKQPFADLRIRHTTDSMGLVGVDGSRGDSES